MLGQNRLAYLFCNVVTYILPVGILRAKREKKFLGWKENKSNLEINIKGNGSSINVFFGMAALPIPQLLSDCFNDASLAKLLKTISKSIF